MDLQSEVHRAGEARQILDSPLFQAAKAHIEAQMAGARQAAPVLATDLHTRLILIEQLWSKLLGYFENIATTGKLADIQIAEQSVRERVYKQGLEMFRKGIR